MHRLAEMVPEGMRGAVDFRAVEWTHARRVEHILTALLESSTGRSRVELLPWLAYMRA